ncbi:hypothetical protein BIW11_04421 [Tropilaelaps mercedesae]|uniref:Uncharacterized protein n=1 Tax=Tropilaelaps mercedesae TaxID=418985 RepID=A0A1V9X744_9ACAR|nr:hypothetical protein BIW11_04421 [Tropilaelaps mercedesae]
MTAKLLHSTYVLLPTIRPYLYPDPKRSQMDCHRGCCYPGLVCSRKLGRCASIFHFNDIERGTRSLPSPHG